MTARPFTAEQHAASLRRRLETGYVVEGDGCWRWTGVISQFGYGRIRSSGRQIFTHRAAYEIFVGPIPAGLQIDHLCRNRACYNPAHLEPVTGRENTRRGSKAQKTHCDSGHPFDEVNTYRRREGGRRQCRTCRRERLTAFRAASKPAPTHGYSGYVNYGCRCDVCRTARRERRQLRQERAA